MKIIVCLDDRDGMMFNRRRQSQDRVLREDVLTLTGKSRLYMNEYSRRQFTEAARNIVVDDAFLFLAGDGDYCFVEDVDVSDFIDVIDTVIVYRWGRVYPSDMRFPTSAFRGRWRLLSQSEFAGSSHKKITREIYSL